MNVTGVDWDDIEGAWVVQYENGQWGLLKDSQDSEAKALWAILKQYQEPQGATDAELDANVDAILEVALAAPEAQGQAESSLEDREAFTSLLSRQGQLEVEMQRLGRITPQTPEIQQRIAILGQELQRELDTSKPPREPTPLQEGQLPEIERGGYIYRYNEATGEYDTPIRPKTPQRTFDQLWDGMADDLFDTGDFRVLADLYDQKQAVEAGRLDPITLFGLVAPNAQNPQHFAELWNGFATEYDNWRAGVLGGQVEETSPGQKDRLTAIPPQAQPQAQPQGGLGLLPGENAAEYGLRTGQGGVPTEEEETGMAAGVPSAPQGFQAQAPTPAPGSSNIPPWQLYGAGYKQEGPMPADQQAQMDAFRVQQPPANPFAQTTGVKTTRTNPFAPTQRMPTPPPQFGGGTMEEGSGFAPIVSGNPLAEAFSRAFNQRQQSKFLQRRPKRMSFK